MGAEPQDPATMRRERIEYIERMAVELGRMATSAGLPVLAYILGMAAEEAALSKTADALRAAPADEPGRHPRAAFGRR